MTATSSAQYTSVSDTWRRARPASQCRASVFVLGKPRPLYSATTDSAAFSTASVTSMSIWRNHGCWPYRFVHTLTARSRRWSWAPRSRSPVHTLGMLAPSSACQISGGRSSIASTMPTWLTGLFVNSRIARSATDRPRNSQTSPVAATPPVRTDHHPLTTRPDGLARIARSRHRLDS